MQNIINGIDAAERSATVKRDIAELDGLQTALSDEYREGNLTSAQRVQVLAEMRKVIYLRSLLTGAIQPQSETEEH